MDQAARYSVQERIKIVEAKIRNEICCPNSTTVSEGFSSFQVQNAPTTLTINRLLDKFSAQDNIKVAVAGHGQSGQKITSLLWDNIWSNLQFTRCLFQETDLSRSSVKRIMH